MNTFVVSLCSHSESSPQQAVEESQSEKGDKYYLAAGLSDGVLQQVEVNVRVNLEIRLRPEALFSLTAFVFRQLSSEAPPSPSATSSPSVNTKRFSCRICMESFHGRSDMENHKRAHLDPNTFKCPDCDFTSTSWLEVKVSHCTFLKRQSYL